MIVEILQLDTNQAFLLNVPLRSTIYHLKEMIQNVNNLDPASIRLRFNKKNLEDGRTVGSYHPEEYALFFLILKNHWEMFYILNFVYINWSNKHKNSKIRWIFSFFSIIDFIKFIITNIINGLYKLKFAVQRKVNDLS